MTVYELIQKLQNAPATATVYTTDPSGWLDEADDVIVQFDEKTNSHWVALVANDEGDNPPHFFIQSIQNFLTMLKFFVQFDGAPTTEARRQTAQKFIQNFYIVILHKFPSTLNPIFI